VLVDILEVVPEEELCVFVEEAALCTVGLANGPARSSYSLASIAMACPALQLARQLANPLLQPFETVRPGTEVFFHNMLGNKPTLVRPRCTMLAFAFSTGLRFWKSGTVQMYTF
jgi:hypothetical protein